MDVKLPESCFVRALNSPCVVAVRGLPPWPHFWANPSKPALQHVTSTLESCQCACHPDICRCPSPNFRTLNPTLRGTAELAYRSVTGASRPTTSKGWASTEPRLADRSRGLQLDVLRNMWVHDLGLRHPDQLLGVWERCEVKILKLRVLLWRSFCKFLVRISPAPC